MQPELLNTPVLELCYDTTLSFNTLPVVTLLVVEASAACKDYKRMNGPWLFDAVPCCPYGIPSQFLTQSETMGSQLPFSCARPERFYDFHGQLLGLTPRAPLHPMNP